MRGIPYRNGVAVQLALDGDRLSVVEEPIVQKLHRELGVAQARTLGVAREG